MVALDLVTHEELWRSANMSSNAQMIIFDGVLVTGYGFTREKASLVVLDLATGRVLQKISLPNAPEEIVKARDSLYVKIYDGYAQLPLTH